MHSHITTSLAKPNIVKAAKTPQVMQVLPLTDQTVFSSGNVKFSSLGTLLDETKFRVNEYQIIEVLV